MTATATATANPVTPIAAAVRPARTDAGRGRSEVSGSSAAAAPVDYLRDVRPILSTSCYQCHGVKAQKGGLRVDTVAALTAGGDTGPAVVPGKSGESLLIRAVTGAEGVTKMPLKKPR